MIWPCSQQHVDLFWIGRDGSVWSNWWDQNASNGAWNQPFDIAPPGSTNPGATVAAVAREQLHLDVFWAAPDGSVLSAWWDQDTGWNAPFSIASPGSAAPGSWVAAAAREQLCVDVFWMGPDGSVGTAGWDQGARQAVWGPPADIAAGRRVIGVR
jgi:hypothetical protein